MTETVELKPCPFCGGAARIVEGEECAYVQCEQVKMHRAIWFDGDNDAANEVADQWNRRAPTIEGEARDTRDDPDNELWTAGVNFAITQLCSIFDVDPKAISWDAATETAEGDVSSVLCNVLVAAYGEEWSSKPSDTARIRSTLSTPQAKTGAGDVAEARHQCATNGPCSDNTDGCSCSDAALSARLPANADGRGE